MASEPINIPIVSSYDDAAAKEALADAEKLDELDPEIKIEADTGTAKADIDEVTRPLDELIAQNPWIAEVKADIGSAHADLDKVQQDLKDTGDASKDAGGKIGKMGGEADQSGSVLANMVGNSSQEVAELGGVAGTAGLALGQLGEYATEGNISLKGLAKVAGPMAGLTLATMALTQGAKQAAAAAEKLGKQIEDLSNVSDEAALNSVTDMMVNQFVAGKDLAGVWDQIAESNIVGARRLADLMAQQGLSEEQTKGLTDAIAKQDATAAQAKTSQDKYGEAVIVAGDESATAAGKVAELAAQEGVAKQKADDLAAAFDNLRGSLDMERTMEDLETDITTAMNNIALGIPPTKEEIRSIEDTIIEVGETAGKNPIEVRNELDKIDNGDLFTVLNDAQSWADQHAVEIQVTVASDVLAKVRAGIAKANAQALTVGGNSVNGTAGSTTVNVHLPRGARHGDIARAMNLSTRRNGRRYGNPSGTVQYARS